MTPDDIRGIVSRLRNRDFADRMNCLTPEEIATAMERLPTDALEWAVRFEAAGRHEPKEKPLRPETGPMQFEGDWPGIFIRGDSAAGIAMNLRAILDFMETGVAIPRPHQTAIFGLLRILMSCDAREKIPGLQYVPLAAPERANYFPEPEGDR